MRRVRQCIGSASFSCEPNSFGRALVKVCSPRSRHDRRRDLLLSIGIFDTDLRTAEDWELFLRLAVATTASVVEMPLVYARRMHSPRLTEDVAGSYRAYADIAARIEKHPGRYPAGAFEVFRSRLPVWLAQAGSLRFRSGDFREAARDYRDALRYRVDAESRDRGNGFVRFALLSTLLPGELPAAARRFVRSWVLVP